MKFAVLEISRKLFLGKLGVLLLVGGLFACSGEEFNDPNAVEPSQISSSPTPTPSSSPSPSPEPTPTIDPSLTMVMLRDFEGNTKTEFVEFTDRLDEVFLELDPNNYADVIAVYEIPLFSSSLDDTFDISIDDDIEMNLRIHLRTEDVSFTEFDEEAGDIIDDIRIYNRGFIYYPEDNRNNFLIWEYVENRLVVLEYPEGSEWDSELRTSVGIGDPNEWIFSPVGEGSESQVIIEINYADGTEIRHINDLKTFENTFVDFPIIEEPSQLFDVLLTDTFRLSFMEYFIPESGTSGGVSYDLSTIDFNFNDQIDTIYRSEITLTPSENLVASYEIRDGLLIYGFARSEEKIVYIPVQYIEEDDLYISCTRRFVSDEELESIQEFCRTKFIFIDTEEHIRHFGVFTTFNEDLALSLLFENEYRPRSGQGANRDADGDGVTNDLDGAPLDPAETLDTDSDGIGDNRDPYPNGEDTIDSD